MLAISNDMFSSHNYYAAATYGSQNQQSSSLPQQDLSRSPSIQNNAASMTSSGRGRGSATGASTTSTTATHTGPSERRRLQNRMAQRTYRKAPFHVCYVVHQPDSPPPPPHTSLFPRSIQSPARKLFRLTQDLRKEQKAPGAGRASKERSRRQRAAVAGLRRQVGSYGSNGKREGVFTKPGTAARIEASVQNRKRRLRFRARKVSFGSSDQGHARASSPDTCSVHAETAFSGRCIPASLQ